jgi:mannose-6-phosphate isomerase-like protein (cupin superfamily)
MKTEGIRPWGNYKVIEKMKLVSVNPHSSISLQYHNHRMEYWRILSGKCSISIGKKTFDAKIGDTFVVPKKVLHRILTKNSAVRIMEIQMGVVYEDDIVRLADDYGRIKLGKEKK